MTTYSLYHSNKKESTITLGSQGFKLSYYNDAEVA